MFSSRPRHGFESLLHRAEPSRIETLWRDPIATIGRFLYRQRRGATPHLTGTPPVTVVCISDTHNSTIDLPSGGILIHAGDLTQSGTREELEAALDWLRSFPHEHKIVIAGNHDLLLDETIQSRDSMDHVAHKSLDWTGLTYLNNSAVTIDYSGRAFMIYGSPSTPRHENWAFQYPRDQNCWHETVPNDVDILVTHGPPKYHLDWRGLGCPFLLREIWRTRPMLHVFGHIHAGYGQESLQYDGVQKAYENMCESKSRIAHLLVLIYEFVAAWFRRPNFGRTFLVNASVTGGLRDELRRKAISITI